ncbi:MAG TPA: type II toxin-antitoxin system RelE/ParE family toxin [Planctomycetota bacterium]|nr:type II toxin-antitoxin system RelE/ParE family toxin [Planctomycetota bacterium]
MTRVLVIQNSARRHWNREFEHYRKIRLELAFRFNAQLERTLHKITEQPLVPRVIYRDFRSVPIKKFPYRVYYRVTEDKILVGVIFHVKRSPRKLKEELRGSG